MPSAKLTGQQEIFAREYVRCGIGAQAYRRAYKVKPDTKPETIWVGASKLLAEPKVAQRVSALMAEAAERAVLSTESLCLELDQARVGALEDGQFAAAVSATMGKAKITGRIVERREITGKDGAAIQVEQQISEEARSAYDFARRIAWLLAQGKLALSGPQDD